MGILVLRFGARGQREALSLVVIGVWTCHGTRKRTTIGYWNPLSVRPAVGACDREGGSAMHRSSRLARCQGIRGVEEGKLQPHRPAVRRPHVTSFAVLGRDARA
jgi:hypothetical protein